MSRQSFPAYLLVVFIAGIATQQAGHAAVVFTSTRSISGDGNDDNTGAGVTFFDESLVAGSYSNSFDLTDSEPIDLSDFARIAASQTSEIPLTNTLTLVFSGGGSAVAEKDGLDGSASASSRFSISFEVTDEPVIFSANGFVQTEILNGEVRKLGSVVSLFSLTGASFQAASIGNTGFENFSWTATLDPGLYEFSAGAQVLPTSSDPYSATADFSFTFSLRSAAVAVTPEPASAIAWSLMAFLSCAVATRRRRSNN